MRLRDDPSAPFHPSEPSPGLLAVALCVTLILAALVFLLR
ncbi:hypothetical protein GMJLKIPL_3174 [Methylobacterium isbiliense]|jgi:hypothetical protein|uniref:Uncharacterized protein n=1 Tax=Methylobacterium isbiliense TaxID=315478 RepID=A0ABQ4SDJ4_9HYPH|nr:hypothetical protein GMJLKIPL_3174 [Methylobacterium isbiliense]